MICSYCNKTAMYRVVGRGFCYDHKREAVKAENRRLSSRKAWAIRQDTAASYEPTNAHFHGSQSSVQNHLLHSWVQVNSPVEPAWVRKQNIAIAIRKAQAAS